MRVEIVNRAVLKALLLLMSLAIMPCASFAHAYTSVAAYAQTEDVTIKGTVTDALTGETLPSASIFIDGTNKGAATDIDGNYVIARVKQTGPITLIASYLGYEKKTVEVTLKPGVNEINIKLDAMRIEGQEVVVTTQAMGQLQAINQQRSSATISSIVARDRIQEMPDVNAAESVGRLPGISIQRSGGEANKVAVRGLSPRFNNVTVNGVRLLSTNGYDRSVDLSLVSSNMLDGIEVTKALTPDQDADALGGTINLRLKNAPDEFTANVQVQGGYTALQDTYNNYKVVGSLSNRFFNKKLGVIVNVNTDKYDRSADNLNGAYWLRELGGDYKVQVESLTLEESQLTRTRAGGSIVLDYRLNKGYLQFNSVFNHLKNDGVRRINDFQVKNQGHFYRMTQGYNNTYLFNNSLTFQKEIGKLQIDANAAYSTSDSESPDDYIWEFYNQGSRDPEYAEDQIVPRTVAESFIIDTLDTKLYQVAKEYYHTTEQEFTSKIDLKLPFRLSDNVSGFVKGGVKYRNKHRENDKNRLNGMLFHGGNDKSRQVITDAYPEFGLDPAGQLPITPFLDDYSRSDFLKGDYPLGFTVQQDLMENVTRLLQEDGKMNYSVWNSLGNDYEGDEEYKAAYLMAKLDIGKHIMFMPGVRLEDEYTDYTGRYSTANDPAEGIPLEDVTSRDTTNVREQTFVLPQVHLQAKLNESVSLRLAYTESINRPNFNEYAPITYYDPIGNWGNAPNSNLKTAKSYNWDASLQIYRNKLGFLTLSAFTKRIENLVWYTSFNLIDGQQIVPDLVIKEAQGKSPKIGTYINNPNDAKVKGFEVDWQTRFWYMPSFLSNMILNVNYTYIHSETDYPAFKLNDVPIEPRPRRPPFTRKELVDTTFSGVMPDQPEHILNVTLGYDFKGFSARLSGIYQARTTTGEYNRPFESQDDLYVKEYFRLDLALKQKLKNNIQLYVNMNNLNGQVDERIQAQSSQYPTRKEYYGFTMDLGLRYTF